MQPGGRTTEEPGRGPTLLVPQRSAEGQSACIGVLEILDLASGRIVQPVVLVEPFFHDTPGVLAFHDLCVPLGHVKFLAVGFERLADGDRLLPGKTHA